MKWALSPPEGSSSTCDLAWLPSAGLMPIGMDAWLFFTLGDHVHSLVYSNFHFFLGFVIWIYWLVVALNGFHLLRNLILVNFYLICYIVLQDFQKQHEVPSLFAISPRAYPLTDSHQLVNLHPPYQAHLHHETAPTQRGNSILVPAPTHLLPSTVFPLLFTRPADLLVLRSPPTTPRPPPHPFIMRLFPLSPPFLNQNPQTNLIHERWACWRSYLYS